MTKAIAEAAAKVPATETPVEKPAKATKRVAKAKSAKAEKASKEVKAAATAPIEVKSSDITKDWQGLTKVDFRSINYTELNDNDALKALNALATSGKNMKAKAHQVLVGILMHYAMHGDYRRLPDFMEIIRRSMGTSARIAAIRFTEAFTSLRFAKGKWSKIEGQKPRFVGQTMPKAFDTKKMLDFTSEKGVKFADFFSVGKADELPTPDDFLAKLAALVNSAHTMLKEKTEGKEVNGKKVIVAHKHIDATQVAALDDFAKLAGIVTNENGKFIAPATATVN